MTTTNIFNGKPTCEIYSGDRIIGLATWKAFPVKAYLPYLDTQEEATKVATRFAASDEMLTLLKEVVDSDMAMREEDEGRESPLLNRCRDIIKRIE